MNSSISNSLKTKTSTETIINWDEYFRGLGYWEDREATFSDWSWYGTPSGGFKVGIKYGNIRSGATCLFCFVYMGKIGSNQVKSILVSYDRYVKQVLEALVDPYQVPLCLGISWAKPIVELLFSEMAA